MHLGSASVSTAREFRTAHGRKTIRNSWGPTSCNHSPKYRLRHCTPPAVSTAIHLPNWKGSLWDGWLGGACQVKGRWRNLKPSVRLISCEALMHSWQPRGASLYRHGMCSGQLGIHAPMALVCKCTLETAPQSASRELRCGIQGGQLANLGREFTVIHCHLSQHRWP